MVEYRPHHFLCTLGFEGKGYSPEFVANFQRIADELRGPGGDSVMIEVVAHTDSLCAPCPNRREKLCTSEAKIQSLDAGHAAVLGLKAGDRITWGDAKQLIRSKMTDEKFHAVCAPCSWKSMGVCESALKRLKATSLSAMLAAGILVQLLSSGASAQSPVPELMASVDTLVMQVTHATPEAKSKWIGKALKKGFSSLEKKDLESARKNGRALQRDGLFQDYGLWLLGASDLIEAQSLFELKKNDDANRAAERAVLSFSRISIDPSSVLHRKSSEAIADAEALVGHLAFAKKRWAAAQGQYERVFQRMGTLGALSLVPLDVFENYVTSCARKTSESCVAWFQRISGVFPKASVETKTILQKMPPDFEKNQAPKGISKTTQAYRAPDSDQVAFDAAIAAILGKSYGDAAKLFRKLLDEFPKSALRYRSQYWLGRSLAENGDSEAAEKIFQELMKEAPLGYYGLLSSFATGHGVETYIDAKLPLAQQRDPFLSASELIRLKKAEFFAANGLKTQAAWELRELRPRDALSSRFIMYLAALNSEVGYHLGAFSMLSELILRGDEGVGSTYAARLIFPIAHYDLIQKHAELNKVDPILALSLMKQESAFDSGALSSSGAVGLMQLMPATAVDTETSIRRAILGEAENNVRIGTRYLGQLLARFNGNIVLSVAAYNAGPNAVERWLKESGGKRDMLEFIESIPYKETRDYVSSIIRNYFWYSRKLNPENPKTLQYFWNPYPAVKPQNGSA